jgi:hypothetical protein
MSAPPVKLIITGALGAGKTSAIAAISEIPPVATDVPMTEEPRTAVKSTTTVAMDYGELTLDDGQKLQIFGTPGQKRYDFMCRILARGALGVVILIDYTRPQAVEDLAHFLDLFRDPLDAGAGVIGVTHCDQRTDLDLEPYYRLLGARGELLPLFPVDARDRDDIVMLVEALLASLEFAA